MTSDQFNEILNHRLDASRATLGRKAQEYAQDNDRLHNFHVAARMAGTTPAKALWGMAAKHLVSVDDLVNERMEATPEIVAEKIGDLVNYLILLEAVFAEAQDHRAALMGQLGSGSLGQLSKPCRART